jgi:hypothetical protein
VTEAEWLACKNPIQMLEFLQGKASARKHRLFGSACCRNIWKLITSESDRKAVEASEDYADGRIRLKDLKETRERTRQDEGSLSHWAVMAASRPRVAPAWIAQLAADARHQPGIHHAYAPNSRPSPDQCRLLRDINGNPFRTVSLSPAVLAWHDATVVRLAQAAYEERHMPAGTLDNGRLAVLADALEEAGCQDPDILGHCRSGGTHVRGCWVIDLILGKT